MNKKARWIFVAVAGIVCILAVAVYLSEQHTFMEIVSKGEITVEGEFIFRGSNQLTVSHVREKHGKGELLIEYPDKSFLMREGQYYVGNGQEIETVDMSINSVREMEEMFDRVSVLSGFVGVELELISRYSTKIPELSSESQVECICEEYRIKDSEAFDGDDVTFRLYYINNNVYAIRSKEDDRFTFYLKDWE